MSGATYDRLKDLIEFDETKAGVKGLSDSGIKEIPRIFKHELQNLPDPNNLADANVQVPVINLEGLHDADVRKTIVAEVCEAARSWGFFQVLNHGIPLNMLDNMLQANKKFHELDVETKAKYYSRDRTKKVTYSSNFDLYTSPAAFWKDTLTIKFDGSVFDSEELPEVIRSEMLEYKEQSNKVAETLCELLSEALGLAPSYLKSINSFATQAVVCHYYPSCPQPELTIGTRKHADPGILTILVQNDLGGLQVHHKDQWVPVSPIPGALVVNIADLLQLVSNEKFKSVEHRVLASNKGPRLSVATFYAPSRDETLCYGPIKELLSNENLPKYKDVAWKDYIAHYVTKGLDGVSALKYYEI